MLCILLKDVQSHIGSERTEKIMHGRLVALGSAAVTKVWFTFEFASTEHISVFFCYFFYSPHLQVVDFI